MSRITSGNNGITKKYNKITHKGVDIGWHSNEEDNKVIAHSDGIVESVVKNYNKTDKTGSSYGNYVLIKHNEKYKTSIDRQWWYSRRSTWFRKTSFGYA